MILTKRDLQLIEILADYGIFSTDLIIKRVFNSIDYSSVLKRLRILEKNNFIRRAGLLENKENVWAVTNKASNYHASTHFKSYWTHANLNHDLKIVKLRLLFEQIGIAKKWIPEHVIRSMIYQKYSLREAKKKLIPDGILECKINKKIESFAIELELNLKSQKRYQQIISLYQWKNDLHGILYIVPSHRILKKLQEIWSKFAVRANELKIFFLVLSELENLREHAYIYSNDRPILMKEMFPEVSHSLAHWVGSEVVLEKTLIIDSSSQFQSSFSDYQT